MTPDSAREEYPKLLFSHAYGTPNAHPSDELRKAARVEIERARLERSKRLGAELRRRVRFLNDNPDLMRKGNLGRLLANQLAFHGKPRHWNLPPATCLAGYTNLVTRTAAEGYFIGSDDQESLLPQQPIVGNDGNNYYLQSVKTVPSQGAISLSAVVYGPTRPEYLQNDNLEGLNPQASLTQVFLLPTLPSYVAANVNAHLSRADYLVAGAGPGPQSAPGQGLVMAVGIAEVNVTINKYVLVPNLVTHLPTVTVTRLGSAVGQQLLVYVTVTGDDSSQGSGDNGVPEAQTVIQPDELMNGVDVGVGFQVPAGANFLSVETSVSYCLWRQKYTPPSNNPVYPDVWFDSSFPPLEAQPIVALDSSYVGAPSPIILDSLQVCAV